MLTDDGPASVEVSRDREGTFEPQLIGKHERRFTGFDDKIIALYARGVTTGPKGMEEAHAAGLSADQAADLHRASAAPEPRLCQLETAQPLAAALRQVPTWLSRRLTPSSAGNGANALESVHAQLRKIIKTPW